MEWKWADGKEWVRSNLANRQGLFQLLNGLSRLTSDPHYKDAALLANRYAFDHLRSPDNNAPLLPHLKDSFSQVNRPGAASAWT